MTRKFALGLAAGVGAALVATRFSRAQLGISFEGRVVLITGGSRGLGLVLARMLVDEGARVAILSRDPAELERAALELQARGAGEVMPLRCDVRRRADVRAALDTLLERWRAIDVLINNAGVIQVGPLDQMDRDDFENAMATHFWGPLHMMLQTIPIMRRRGFGRIVNISSIGGRIALPHLAPYSASKFALVGLSDAVRAEVEADGIRVTTVAPGLMRTGSPVNAHFKGQHEAEYAWFKVASSIPGLTIGAERAARRIIEACRYGDPVLTITTNAKLAAAANVVLPGTAARVMMLISRMLPAANGAAGHEVKKGIENEAKTNWSPSLLTKLSDTAALANNEL
jgi:NAD(P)-dependent dehydrogenase (short-subunit alcohol dehydrogenase family)